MATIVRQGILNIGSNLLFEAEIKKNYVVKLIKFTNISAYDMDGNVVTTYSIGALCGLAPDYLPYNKWNHGFATIETDLDGEYEFRNLRISDGKVR